MDGIVVVEPSLYGGVLRVAVLRGLPLGHLVSPTLQPNTPKYIAQFTIVCGHHDAGFIQIGFGRRPA